MMRRDIPENMHGEVPPLGPECGVEYQTIHDGVETPAGDGDASTALFGNYGTINSEGGVFRYSLIEPNAVLFINLFMN